MAAFCIGVVGGAVHQARVASDDVALPMLPVGDRFDPAVAAPPYDGASMWAVTVSDPSPAVAPTEVDAISDSIARPVPGSVAALASGEGVELAAPVSDGVWMVVTAEEDAAFERRAAAIGGLEVADADVVGYASVSNDPSAGMLWGLSNPYTPGFDVAAGPAWTASTGAGAVVAVIDTGVIDHADLPAENRWRNPGEDCRNGVDDDGNGYVDDCWGWDFYRSDPDPRPDPGGHAHGSHIAGTIAAEADNGVGVVGLAHDAQIMNLRVSHSGSFPGLTAVAAIRYAADNGADVINASFGFESDWSPMRDAVQYALDRGVLVVAAAGNDGRNLDGQPAYPASYPLDGLVSVGAADQWGSMATYSNHSSTQVDLFAPGSSVYSFSAGRDGYQYMSGTSMAAPHVAAAAALLVAQDPAVSPAEIHERLTASAAPHDTLAGRARSGGLLDAATALGVPAGSPSTTVTWDGLHLLRPEEPANLRLGVSFPAGVVTAPASDVVVSLLRAHDGGAYGVIGHPVIVDGAPLQTDDRASVTVASGIDVAGGSLAAGSSHDIELALPAGAYALVVEPVDGNDPSRAVGPVAITYVVVDDVGTAVSPTTTTTTEVPVSPDPQAPGPSQDRTREPDLGSPTPPGTVPTVPGIPRFPWPPSWWPPSPSDPSPSDPSPSNPSDPAPRPGADVPRSGTQPGPVVPGPNPTRGTPRSPVVGGAVPGESPDAPSSPDPDAGGPTERDSVPSSPSRQTPVTENGMTIRSFSPVAGSTRGGTTVSIAGNGFPLYPRVLFGGRLAALVRTSPTSLTVRTPPGAVGTVDVVVGDYFGRTVTMPASFTYRDATSPGSLPPTTPRPVDPDAGAGPAPDPPPRPSGPTPTGPTPTGPSPTTEPAPDPTRPSRLVVGAVELEVDGLALAPVRRPVWLLDPAGWRAASCSASSCRAAISLR